jgi:hypothetical protein
VSDPASVDAIVLRRSHILRNVGIVVGVVACLTSFLLHGDLRLMWFIGAGMTGVGLAVLGAEGRVRRVRGSVSAQGLRIGDELLLARAAIRSAWVERSFDGTRVRLDRALLPDLELEAADDGEAHTILRALACDESQAVVRFPSAYRYVGLAGTAGMLGQICAHEIFRGEAHPLPSLLLVYVATCLAWLVLVFALTPRETTVGADGMLLATVFRRRFIPYPEIDAVAIEAVGKLVVYTRTHGKLVSRMSERAAQSAAELIQSKIAISDRSSAPVLEQLRRDTDRDAGKWLARLRSLAIDTPYRAAALATDALWRVVDDPSASGAERAAAAVVLGSAATPADRARLRDAAARIVSPRVRMAIQQVSDGANEDELAVALEAVAAHDSAHDSAA